MEKQKLRQLAITRLQRLAESEERSVQVDLILTKLFKSDVWQTAASIGVTMATSFEFPTDSVIQQALAAGKKVAVPKSLPQGKMVFHWIEADTPFYTTRFGVKEPEIEALAEPAELDLLLVPGLVYNQAGYRIGFGGGYYDRYLANYQGKTCSLVFAEQLMEDWQAEAFDQPIQQLFLA
ncbi:5-formyltetrahydrofolate cyclo-ligase [Enterococcus pseudoavium]|uniref:5-formyltetrahydrofolate cyclo-ligase n=1 Tax=Enterococcus pseudoavium TaxID=44007 RepID=A0AAE4I2U3_9ENTE|nr:5-formyltetrahydrofolate cyclo-ligase [Enterococcus pseudoavium]MDT2736995.1 5-formyltetrahydrofolate cyclo-ligase [Enterococcus pseudoavium]